MKENEMLNMNIPPWVFVLIILVFAYFCGYATKSYQIEQGYDYEQAYYRFERYMNFSEELPEFIRVRANENMSIADARGMYFNFKPWAQMLLKSEIEQICGAGW